jgi:hypothetical protein
MPALDNSPVLPALRTATINAGKKGDFYHRDRRVAQRGNYGSGTEDGVKQSSPPAAVGVECNLQYSLLSFAIELFVEVGLNQEFLGKIIRSGVLFPK